MSFGPLARRRFMRDHRWTGAHMSEYLDGELSERERHRLEHHTGICPECRRMLRTLQRTVSELMGLRAPPAPSVAEGVIERLRRSW